MTRHILITTDRKKDNISIFQEESIILIIADREDLLTLKKVKQCEQSGIYILLGDNHAYVGQASNSFYRRLTKHDKDKPWWNRVIFFTRTANDFGKQQTDYLEKKLISLYNEESNFVTENKTSGNSSYIDIASEMIANNSLDIVLSILENVANVNIFESTQLPEEEPNLNQEITNSKIFNILINGTTKIEGKSARNTYVNFVKYLLKNPKYYEVLVAEGEPLSKREGNQGKFVGTKKRVSPNGAILTQEIQPNIFLFTNYNKLNTTKAVQKIARQVNVSVEINF